MVPNMKRVLILCTGNSCRSQMAQTIWQHLGNGQWQAESAGSKPAGFVHPNAIRAIEELGLSVDGLESKSVDLFLNQPIDLVVTVCDNALEACPTLPGVSAMEHWPFDDPADATGTDNEIMDCFRRVRDEIFRAVERYLRTGE